MDQRIADRMASSRDLLMRMGVSCGDSGGSRPQPCVSDDVLSAQTHLPGRSLCQRCVQVSILLLNTGLLCNLMFIWSS